MKSTRIGEYTVVKAIGRINNNAVSYEVTKDHPQKVTRIAELHNLNAKLDIHKLLKIMRSGEGGVAE